jgi:hypothetical protein
MRDPRIGLQWSVHACSGYSVAFRINIAAHGHFMPGTWAGAIASRVGGRRRKAGSPNGNSGATLDSSRAHETQRARSRRQQIAIDGRIFRTGGIAYQPTAPPFAVEAGALMADAIRTSGLRGPPRRSRSAQPAMLPAEHPRQSTQARA